MKLVQTRQAGEIRGAVCVRINANSPAFRMLDKHRFHEAAKSLRTGLRCVLPRPSSFSS